MEIRAQVHFNMKVWTLARRLAAEHWGEGRGMGFLLHKGFLSSIAGAWGLRVVSEDNFPCEHWTRVTCVKEITIIRAPLRPYGKKGSRQIRGQRRSM